MNDAKRERGDPTCIFYRETPQALCTALIKLDCKNCSFYKDKRTHYKTKQGFINIRKER